MIGNSERDLQKMQYGSNVAVNKYIVFPGFPPIENRVRFIGPLKGSWHEMGIQYGEEAGDIIRWVFDAWWITARDIISNFGKSHVIEDLHRYEQSIFFLSPELIEFMKGIAEGASPLLSESLHASQCTHYEKVLLINVCTSLIWNHPPSFRHTENGSARINNKSTGAPVWPHRTRQQEGCSHFAVVGDHGGGKDGKTFHAHSRDTEFCPWNYNVFFIAVPNAMGSKPWWTLAMAGQVSGNMAGNISGVSIGSSAGAIPPMGETPLNERGFGVPISCFRAFAAAYGNSAAEAAHFFTIGTEDYRSSTGRETLLRDFGNNELFVDGDECIVIEATACRYGMRRPEQNGETGNYIVVTNHQCCTESYDENNMKTEIPMKRFGDELSNQTSATRFWSLMWMIKNHYGIIDEPLIMNKFMRAHYFYDKEGGKHNTYDQYPSGKIPAHNAGATVCRHLPGYPDPFTGGSNDVKLFSLDDKEVYYTQGRTCEWHGPWDNVGLRNYIT